METTKAERLREEHQRKLDDARAKLAAIRDERHVAEAKHYGCATAIARMALDGYLPAEPVAASYRELTADVERLAAERDRAWTAYCALVDEIPADDGKVVA